MAKIGVCTRQKIAWGLFFRSMGSAPPTIDHPSAGHPSAGHPSAGHPSAGHPWARSCVWATPSVPQPGTPQPGTPQPGAPGASRSRIVPRLSSGLHSEIHRRNCRV